MFRTHPPRQHRAGGRRHGGDANQVLGDSPHWRRVDTQRGLHGDDLLGQAVGTRRQLPGSRFHHLVLPLVAALKEHCDVLEVAGPVDHRARGHGGARPGWSSGAWAVPGSAAQLAALGLPVPDLGDRVRLQFGGRPLWALWEDGHCVHLAFDELCAGWTSVGDALELADRYRTLVLAGVPPLAQVTEDARRRFADLVDVL